MQRHCPEGNSRRSDSGPKKKKLTAKERQRLESSYSPVRDVFIDVSVLNEDVTSWGRREDTILRYSIDRNEYRIRIESNLGYLASFARVGPIEPLNYLTPTHSPFKWDFPILDFKVLNNRQVPLFLTEVVLDIAESLIDPAPLLTIKKDTQQRNAGNLVLINEGGCDLTDLTISFHLLSGQIAALTSSEPPFQHSLTLPVFEDHAEVDVTQAFREEGADIDGLMLLGNGRWDKDAFVVPKADGLEERMTEVEVNERWKKCLGRFSNEVGTLAGEISLAAADSADRRHSVKFHAPVYLANRNRMSITKPPTFMYDTNFETKKTGYQRRVQISQELQPGETDRFTIKVAVAKSSFHRFRATLIDITGLALESLPIEIHCFVP